MILYKNDAIGFRDAVDRNCIAAEIESAFIEKMGHSVSPNEKKSWNYSLRFMETAIRKSAVPNDCGVLIEYNIPSTSKRIDFIISGHDEDENENFVIVELKQWESAQATDKEDIVTAFVGGSMREVLHPSRQARNYKQYLRDMNEAIYTKNLNPYSCSYLHNYSKKQPDPLLSEQYKRTYEDTPIFFSQDAELLEKFIRKYVGKGNGLSILYEIEHGRIKPSKKFVEYVSDMFDGNDVYTLLDEQQVAYSNIMKFATSAKNKTTIIVNGGPGTGKSVVAMNAFVNLLKRRNNIKFVAPNASFKEAMIEMLSNNGNSKSRLKALFSGSMGFYDSEQDVFDILIVDEAHRLKSKGTYMYKGDSQVEDIIRSSRVNVFFIDDNQCIRPNDEGTVAKVKEIAEKYNSDLVEVELKAQFRCSGAEGFINWVTHSLQIEDTGNYDGWDKETFEFAILDDPHSLVQLINKRNEEGFKARIVAGFAWPWTSEKNGNSNAEVCDVSIPEYDFKMPWNSHSNQYTWSVEKAKQNQIGCVHTVQGLEFDYVGVVIGKDLQYNPETHELYASYNDYYDSTGKRGLKSNNEQLTLYIKNIYKVLMSRGMKGCYIFCCDKNLQDYFKSRLIENKFND